MSVVINQKEEIIIFLIVNIFCYGPDGDGKHGPCPYWDYCKVRFGENEVCRYIEIIIKGKY